MKIWWLLSVLILWRKNATPFWKSNGIPYLILSIVVPNIPRICPISAVSNSCFHFKIQSLDPVCLRLCLSWECRGVTLTLEWIRSYSQWQRIFFRHSSDWEFFLKEPYVSKVKIVSNCFMALFTSFCFERKEVQFVSINCEGAILFSLSGIDFYNHKTQ